MFVFRCVCGFMYVCSVVCFLQAEFVFRCVCSCLRVCVCVRFLQAEFVWHKLSADNMDPDFVERRRVGLENFLQRVTSHPVLSHDSILYRFLTEVRDTRDEVMN